MDQTLQEKYNMKINKKKTKVMVFSKSEHGMNDIIINNDVIKSGNEYTDLGSLITKDGRFKKEINQQDKSI